uniref:Exonuclease domain-containing protein n=2 Tax=Odontella aurita TaxID=265563 RepID=A0A7S4KAW0_9STRA|mmetsp:Transcript_8312/g.25038  ORF Transcript_8312/g.25038 Transcript_8312/m.25038 type:complete len:111 (+) Transcript_8312:892-1224(+)
MAGMLRELGMELRGRHHSGIDDCRNIARICERMLKDGWVPGGGRSSVSTPPKSGGTEAASGVPAKENVHVGVKGTSRGGWVDEGKVREAVYSALDEADCGGSRRRGRNRS